MRRLQFSFKVPKYYKVFSLCRNHSRINTHTHADRQETHSLRAHRRTAQKLRCRSAKRTASLKGPTHRRTYNSAVLIVSACCSWQVWCPFKHRLREGRKCWHGHLSREFCASGQNLLMSPTVSRRNFDKGEKLYAHNFFCASCGYATLFWIFHTISFYWHLHPHYKWLLETKARKQRDLFTGYCSYRVLTKSF